MADSALPIWQSALLTRGCGIQSGSGFIPLELRPVGERIICTPSASGALLPFNVNVTVGEPVTITWDNELSRYVLTANGRPIAA